MGHYLRRKEIAELLSVNIQTVDRWRREDGLPFYKFGATTNGAIRFVLDEVKEWAERRKHNAGMQSYTLPRTSGFEPKHPPEDDKEEWHSGDDEYLPPEIY
jgi:excisionase family DNA binding protein